MLKFKLDEAAPRTGWHWDGTTWRNDGNWIEPFQHPMLECAALTDGSRMLVIVRERKAGHKNALFGPRSTVTEVSTQRYHRLLEEVEEWPLDFLIMEMRSNREVKLTAGQYGTAPVYLITEAGWQRGSWDLTDFQQLTDNDHLVPREIARQITLSFRYSHETAWANIHRLTERATASFRRTGIDVHYPQPALHSAPRELAPGADPVKGFELLTEQVIGERDVPWDSTAVALSGGVDSANIAMSLAAMRPEHQFVSFAMMLGGPAGPQQARRRALMVERGRFKDVTVPILEHLPLSPNGGRAKQQVSPYEEIYIEGYAKALEALKKSGIDTVFEGTGGDEMVSLRDEEWPTRDENWTPTYPRWVSRESIEHLAAIEENAAPASVISEVTLIAFASIAPTYLRAGMWPVSPYASELIRFGEWLPLEWRQGKRLLRERLISLGFPTEIGHPEQRENFAHVMEHAITKHGLPMVRDYLGESMLVDYGYVDGDGLRESYEAARFSSEEREELYQFLNWELGLRAFSNP